MNTLTKYYIIQKGLNCVRRMRQAGVKIIGISWVTAALIILLIPRPGIPVAPGGCTSTSGECGTSINV